MTPCTASRTTASCSWGGTRSTSGDTTPCCRTSTSTPAVHGPSTSLWDLAGQVQGRPVWDLLGGRARRVRAYAPSVHRPVAAMVDVARQVQAAGFPALKVRWPAGSGRGPRRRSPSGTVGDGLELMVDCNQGWRMPWDTAPPWTLDHATEIAEPSRPSPSTGWRSRSTGVTTRGTPSPPAGRHPDRRWRDDPELYELRELLARDCLDVFQPDCVCTGGITGLATLAAEIDAAGRVFTPHTWGNGIGLLANLHLTAGTVDTPFIEYPFDPPEWTPARRDYPLARPIEIDDEGWLGAGRAGPRHRTGRGALAATRPPRDVQLRSFG